MLSYATIGVSNLEKSEAFYNELLAPLGAKTLIKMDRIIFIGKSMAEPMFLTMKTRSIVAMVICLLSHLVQKKNVMSFIKKQFL